MDLGERLREYMVAERVTQEDLAFRSGTSQSTVCRALRYSGGRTGPAVSKVFIVAGLAEYLIPNSPDPKERVMRAFEQVWDGTGAHADAIANVIGAMADLRPVSRKGRGLS